MSKKNAFPPEEISESYTHGFHFSTLANQQKITLSGKTIIIIIIIIYCNWVVTRWQWLFYI